MDYFLGIDIGSVNVKLALIDNNARPVYLDSEKIISSPQVSVNSLIDKLSQKYQLEQITGAGTTGTGRDIIPEEVGWTAHTSPLSIASSLLNYYSDVKTIIQIGGQSSFILELEDGLKRPWKVVSNPLCAAGTGRFIEQQAYRLGITMEDFASTALRYQGSPPRIAARCSVFAKSDLIHLQQKGVSLEAMLCALSESIARMVLSLKKGVFTEPIFFVGGVAANVSVVRSLNESISLRNGHEVKVIIPENYFFMESLGSAILSQGQNSRSIMIPNMNKQKSYYQMPKLNSYDFPVSVLKMEKDKSTQGFLGVDIGSTSTKAVILDETGKNVIAKSYLMTAGRPVDAIRQVFKNLLSMGAESIKIMGVGVTGSGRYLIGSFLGADLVKNEITAQTRAAVEIEPEADIIEIGGQDSKLIIKRNGVVVDYQMNKACAAGTGSFIDELAEMLGISVSNGDFAKLAFNAPYTIDLGTRCAAFMGQAVASAQQQSVSLEIITASLSHSIVKNYLSKVVGNKKLGRKIILTGAVFYNQAIVSAFKNQLEGKQLIVAEHKEVTGAIGAALLSKESIDNRQSKFRGFREVVDSECNLSSFTCKTCENNCAITRMQVSNERPTFYGSRCDLFDSTFDQTRVETYFHEREKMLFKDYNPDTGSGLKVGIPQALLVYDYAPLLIGFLNALNVKVVISGKTNKEIIEKSVSIGYSDSCLPIKLLHGHVSSLKDVDYIIMPCFIRLGEKDGNENQKYACPLVQAAPFIVRQVMDLKEKMLIPLIDFSSGFAEPINNLTTIAMKMGFSKEEGKQAAITGFEMQHKYDMQREQVGIKVLQQIEEKKQIGVVIFSRSYMAQDSGANLGIAEKLARLGVVPIPLDFLPLSSVNPKLYSDRPYWYYESRQIAAAAITAANPLLYGLVITNFGCGPNSFIIKIIEDINGDKPLGQIEIDEHAAEAGIITRLEAYVDTIKGFANNYKQPNVVIGDIYRGASPVINTKKTLLLPRMCPHADILAAALQACGARAIVLPEPDERNILYSSQVTNGTECLPFRVCLGDFIKYYYDNGNNLKNVEGFMPGSYGPCRLGKYSIEQMRLLKEIGIDLPIRTSVSNNAYRDMDVGPGFERLTWKGIVAFDYLQRLLWHTRPYEKNDGMADLLFSEYGGRIAKVIQKKGNLRDVLYQAISEFANIVDKDIPRKPVIGINGEIFLRLNRFSNSDLVKVCERAGLEVMVSSLGEWFKYTAYRNLEDAITDRKIKKIIVSFVKKLIQEHDEKQIMSVCHDAEENGELSTEALLEYSGFFLSPKCGSEAVLSIGSGIEWMENKIYAGVISVMPHGCMPGGIVAAMAEKFSDQYHKPWINLTFDGFLETNNLSKIDNLAEIVKFCNV